MLVECRLHKVKPSNIFLMASGSDHLSHGDCVLFFLVIAKAILSHPFFH